jgi:hypothetical protein
LTPPQICQERAHPPKLTDQSRRALNRVNDKTKNKPEGVAKLHSEDWSICPQDHLKLYTAQSGQKKPLFNERKWCLPKGMWETPQACGRRYSGQMR